MFPELYTSGGDQFVVMGTSHDRLTQLHMEMLDESHN